MDASGWIEETLGAIFVDGYRCEVSVRSEPDTDGTWHNALVFRRNVRALSREALITGVEWHLPPGIALQRAEELDENERIALFRRALDSRAPLI